MTTSKVNSSSKRIGRYKRRNTSGNMMVTHGDNIERTVIANGCKVGGENCFECTIPENECKG